MYLKWPDNILGKLIFIIWIIVSVLWDFICRVVSKAADSFIMDKMTIKMLSVKTKGKFRTILSFFSTIPLLLGAVFVGKCSIAEKGNMAFEAAVLITIILFLQRTIVSLFRDKFMEGSKLYVPYTNVFFCFMNCMECVLFLCLWQEMGLGALVVYLFGSILLSEARWLTKEWDTTELEFKEKPGKKRYYHQLFLEENALKMTIGTVVFLVGVYLCFMRFTEQDISPMGLICALLYTGLKLVKSLIFLFGKRNERNENDVRKVVWSGLIPVMVAVAAWGIFSGFSVNMLSAEYAPWNILLFVCILANACLSGGYYGSFHRIASFSVLIPAGILLWSTVGMVSVWGVLIMVLGKVIFMLEEYWY